MASSWTDMQFKAPQTFPHSIDCGYIQAIEPKMNEFFNETIIEFNNLINGININEEHFEVKLLCVICDAPAKALVKCVKQFSGYFGCDKCEQRGRYIGRMTYPFTENLVLRSDATFRNQTQEGHRKEGIHSPFVNLPIYMIQHFPIDYMH